MQPLHLHDFHKALGAHFGSVDGAEAVLNYGDKPGEYLALQDQAAILDLSFRSRLCLTGTDRVRFLHGQVTNDIKRLQIGDGCYAALVNAKGRMESDLNVYGLTDEILLDFEPGLAEAVSQRLGKYIVADEVQAINVGPLYGLLSVQGPRAELVVAESGLFSEIPTRNRQSIRVSEARLGEVYLMNLPRLATSGFDIFIPTEALATAVEKLNSTVRAVGGRLAGWDAFDAARIEAGIPRFGVDMDGSNFPQECGIEASAVSYTKGCYIGQEVLNRIHTMGHVNRQLCGLRLLSGLKLPVRGEKLFYEGKKAGWITSTATSPKLKEHIALGLIRNEAASIGTELKLGSAVGETICVVVLPLAKPPE